MSSVFAQFIRCAIRRFLLYSYLCCVCGSDCLIPGFQDSQHSRMRERESERIFIPGFQDFNVLSLYSRRCTEALGHSRVISSRFVCRSTSNAGTTEVAYISRKCDYTLLNLKKKKKKKEVENMSFLHVQRALFGGRRQHSVGGLFFRTANRRFGGGHKTIPGQLQVPHVHQWHKDFAEYSMMAMWLWILYRFKEDGAYLLVSRPKEYKSR